MSFSVVTGLVLVIALSPVLRAAQSRGFSPSQNSVTEAVRIVFDTESKNLISSAELMPANKYDYRPTPAQITFGQLIVHVVQTNFAICGGIADVAVPMEPAELGNLKETGGKDALVPMLRRSFDFCGLALAKANDAMLSQEATMFGRGMGMSHARAMITIATDWTDHYSTAASYLRLNGILPPSAQPGK